MYTQIDDAIAQGKAKKREHKPPIVMAPLLTHLEPPEGATPFKWDFWNTPVHPLTEPDVYTDTRKYRDLFKGLPAMHEEQKTVQQNTRNATTSPIQKDTPIQIAPAQDRLKPDYTQEMYEYVLNNTPPDPGVARAYIAPNAAEKAKRWLSEQSIISPFAWMTGHASPPPSAAQDLAKPLAYFIPNGIGLAKAVTEACLGIASGKPATDDYVTLGLSVLPYAKGLSNLKITTSEGFLFGSVGLKTPINLKVGLYASERTRALNEFQYSTIAPESLGAGTEEFARRMLQITPEFQEEIGQWTHQTVPKNTYIRIGLVGPQSGQPIGSWLQIFAPNAVEYINHE